MKKKIIPITLVLSFLIAVPAIADMPISILVNGNKIKTDVNPIIVDGSTMVPLRAISEALGANVTWDEDTKTVFISTTTQPPANIVSTTPVTTNEDTSSTTKKLYNSFKSNRYNFEQKYAPIIKDREEDKVNGMGIADSRYHELAQAIVESAYDFWIDSATEERDYIYSLINVKYGLPESSELTSSSTYEDFAKEVKPEYINPISYEYKALSEHLDKTKNTNIYSALIPNLTQEQKEANKETFENEEKKIKKEFNAITATFSTATIPQDLVGMISKEKYDRIDILKKIYHQEED